MSQYLSRFVFASASIVLTLAMVAASSPAAAAVGSDEVHSTVVKLSDLKLTNVDGRHELDRGLAPAAAAVCPLGDAMDGFAQMQCRVAVIERARLDIDRRQLTNKAAAA